jgi:glutamyl-tRNA synthetase
MVGLFSLERVNKAPASFDPKKLFAFQERYLQQLPVEQKVDLALPYLQKAGLASALGGQEMRDRMTQILVAAADRIKVGGDILDYAAFFLTDDQMVYDDQAFDKRIRKPPEAARLLPKFKEELARVEPFTTAALEARLQEFVQSQGIQIGQIIHALRVAVTGKAVGFGLFESLAILGRKHCLARINRALARL